ncbi:putative ABC transport system permease protein [Breznakia sp. PF5-3]|uniref:ABC transporter ATP-binding protein/permease n=1 Tax=unclassified Breznakia TaxID=2623764 RepID=UPI0024075E43|nr:MULTISPECIES: ABC transporter ATP-binding protein/permease [unclassified Breznakia]MDF9824755.1 putative ABC transport system permease protein [Breznakia sp. PM6-1]MDF9835678.1 putative ABC transport system permease protein [Breznakia sp. PF5-3]MDF9837727.1 putative ABC transport system permease protein [Breznakia sp. PFB2-8]MDF9859688.1 putative ABC transport system permease protein [Breznakia sp. PH5-24]
MLKLTNIRKSYKTYNFTQVALNDVSILFRDNEFAAILGSSGSGKTTMLNIIGGLDRYDSGDLEIDGISTKKYTSSDWDAYRNNRIGFVFQSYNLIPHQTILSNVELALTLSGVSKAERRKKAKAALEEVGLLDHIRKLPSQLSGGQMQRVAIARALINDPEILLADEPTGALDTKTSEQVMELLTRIAKNRLVIMVTHNPALADKYANRIIQLKDGEIIDDTNPLSLHEEMAVTKKAPRKVSMSFLTAISLSLSNMMTKKGRTFITSLAGSIGIIGIAAILALASGINAYIANIEEETMSVYPLTIQASGIDITSMLGDPENMTTKGSSKNEDSDVGVRNIFETMFSYQNQNDLTSLKAYIEKNNDKIDPYVKNIQYKYDIIPQIYLTDTSKGIYQVSPDAILKSYGIGSSTGMSAIMGNSSMMGMNNFHELPGDSTMFENQYDIKAGRWPKKYDETVLVLTSNGNVSDYVLYSLGLKDRDELKKMLDTFVNEPGKSVNIKADDNNITFNKLMNSKLTVIHPSDKYVYDEKYKVWIDKSDNDTHMKQTIEQGVDLKIVGVVQADPDATATSLASGINYTPELTQYLITTSADTKIVKEQLNKPTMNIFTGKSFVEEKNESNSQFDFKELFTIDEDAIRNAFHIDTSQLNVDMSSFDINMNDITLPEMNLGNLNQEIAGQINIPADKLNAIMENVLRDFVQEQIRDGVSDPEVVIQNLIAYLNRDDVQANINRQLAEAIDTSQLSDQLSKVIQEYMTNAMQTYVTQMMTTLQNQIQNQIQSALEQFPQQMQNAMSIDQEAFAAAFKLNISEDDILDLMTTMLSPNETTLESNLSTLGYADIKTPNQINIYPKDFTSKENVIHFLQDYNHKMEKAGNDDKVVRYSDIVGTMMSSVTDIVDTISYTLVAFVAISLIVSSIMIGVITYISVLERKKEIGILRAIGASKRDIRWVFNAETLIIGFIAGMIGIVVTYLLSIVANIIVYNELGIANIAQLPPTAAAILVLISMALAFISGLFPSSAAARKDPVEALRSE